MEVESFAPGRVELLGNHTDYNEGLVLSAALGLGITARGRSRGDRRLVFRSADMEEEVDVDAMDKTGTWADYALGVVKIFRDAGHAIGGVEVTYHSTLPTGAGLSSSAAMELSTALLLLRLFDLKIPPMDVARLCRKAENEFVGVQCGLLDQATSALGREGRAVFMDFRTETAALVPFPAGHGLLIIESGVRHALTGGEYNERRASCFEAARLLGVRTLRDASEADLAKASMPDLPRRRAAHILGENRRVADAAALMQAGDAIGFGLLMNESHESSIHHFENSTPELDILASLVRLQPGILGARLTGGGFGGSIVALGENAALESAGRAVAALYGRQTGHRATPIVCHPGDGAFARAGFPVL